MAASATRQRSFRLANQTLSLLDERAAEQGESSNALAQRLLDESLRLERHPMLRFREGGSGIRRPALAGTRLDVWQVIATLRAHDGDVASTAEYFAITSTQVRACIAYYADFQAEIDAYAAADLEAAERERERWEREQRVLG
ncbi:MAG TPA: DUF433 domain-containing protein [Solirubrobacteraceae bacterium]|jgi:uncharacterized protein (DUF433 family)|nr:DUF433 domain-containing protein [Solirubrobacteraceae bacterium]